MQLYISSLLCLGTAELYATQTNKVKSLEICKTASEAFKNYTMQEFIEIKSNDTECLSISPGIPVNDKIATILYEALKSRILSNDDARLIKLNGLLKSLTDDEEKELRDVVVMTITRPGEILYRNVRL